MKILFVVPYVPSLVRVRPYNMIRYLQLRGHEVSLMTLWSEDQELVDIQHLRSLGFRVEAQHQPKMRSMWNSLLALPTQTPLQSVYSWQPAVAKKLHQMAGGNQPGFDVVHVEHLRGARYGLALRSTNAAVLPPLVWDSVDSISMLFRQAASQSRSMVRRWITRLELSRTERYEAYLAGQFDRVLVSSSLDQRAFLELAEKYHPAVPVKPHSNGGAVSVVANGVNLDYFSPARDSTRQPATVVVSGKMSYHANIAMTLHLVNDILPLVWATRPDVKLWVVGKDPPREILALAQNPAVTVTGTVKDIRPYLQQATVAAVPLTYGAGIQNKVLEAMSSATAVVSSSQAVSALDVFPGKDLLVADRPQRFAESILCLLDDAERRNAVGQAGRRYVETHHRWETIARRLEEIYAEEIATRAQNHP